MSRLLAIVVILFSLPVRAEQLIQSPSDFIGDALGEIPEASVMWLTGELRERAAEILGHPPVSLRQRYWQTGDRSVWIIDEIGKESPITAGFVIDKGRLQRAQVLVYRETRGAEIQMKSFLRQFSDASLNGQQLDRSIDNITGATLSVRAMKRMALLALDLHKRLSTD